MEEAKVVSSVNVLCLLLQTDLHPLLWSYWVTGLEFFPITLTKSRWNENFCNVALQLLHIQFPWLSVHLMVMSIRISFTFSSFLEPTVSSTLQLNWFPSNLGAKFKFAKGIPYGLLRTLHSHNFLFAFLQMLVLLACEQAPEWGLRERSEASLA